MDPNDTEDGCDCLDPKVDDSLFDKETAELKEMMEAFANLVEDRPYSPNRAQRRAQAKAKRKKR